MTVCFKGIVVDFMTVLHGDNWKPLINRKSISKNSGCKSVLFSLQNIHSYLFCQTCFFPVAKAKTSWHYLGDGYKELLFKICWKNLKKRHLSKQSSVSCKSVPFDQYRLSAFHCLSFHIVPLNVVKLKTLPFSGIGVRLPLRMMKRLISLAKRGNKGKC